MSPMPASAASDPRRIAEAAREMIEECWKKWQKVDRRIRYSVYAGALLGLAFYPILGFCAAGVVEGSIAAAIQSSIGNVAAGSGFALMQSLGAKGILAWLLPLLGAVITPAAVEIVIWIQNRILRFLKWLSSLLSVAIPTDLVEVIELVQDGIRRKQSQLIIV